MTQGPTVVIYSVIMRWDLRLLNSSFECLNIARTSSSYISGIRTLGAVVRTHYYLCCRKVSVVPAASAAMKPSKTPAFTRRFLTARGSATSCRS